MNLPRPSRRSQRWLIALASLIGVLAVAAFIGAFWLAHSLPEVVAQRTGRRIEVRGSLQVNLLSLRPTVVARDVLIGNPPWMPRGVLAEVSAMRVVVDLPLPFRSLTIRRLELSDARLHLVRDAEGRANWQMQDPREPRRGDGAMIHGLLVSRATVTLDDARRHLKFSGTVSVQEVATTAGALALKLRGEGQLNGRDGSFEILGDPLATAKRGKPYRFTLDERSDGARLMATGVLPKPFDIGQMQASFEASGSSLHDIYRMTGFAMPETAEFSLTGKLARQHERATFSDLKGRVGESDIDGTVTLATEDGKRRFETDLHAKLFRLQDLGKHGDKPKSGAFDVPIPFGIVKNRDGTARLRADRLIAGPLELGQFAARAAIRDSVLEVPSMEWRLHEARFTGSMDVDASSDTPRTNLDLSIAGFRLEHLSRKNWKQPPLDGPLHARLHLDADGNSLRQFASTVDGTVTAVLPRGAMRASLAELTGVNLRGIGLAMKKDASDTEVRCAIASFEGTDGVFKSQQLLIDTDAVLIEGDGAIDLRSASLDMTFRGSPKKLRLGRVRSPLHVQGPLRNPSFSLDAGRLMAQTGEAVLLGVALTPMAAALALVDPGLAHDANCAELVKPASAPTKGR